MSGDPECSFEKGIYREQQISYFCGNALACRIVGNVEALQRAKLNLETKFHFVGLAEEMGKSLKLLERELPRFFKGLDALYKELDNPWKNVNLHPQISEEAKSALGRKMSHEIDFYNYARAAFHKLIDSLDI